MWTDIDYDDFERAYQEHFANNVDPETTEGKASAQAKEFLDLINGFELKDNVHGGDEEGTVCYAVYHFPKADLYIQFDGWYASHHGSEYEEMFEVIPKEIKVTKWERKKS